MSEAKPLPCPFCGGEFAVEEMVPGTWVLVHVDGPNQCVGNIIRFGGFDSKEKAIDAWNTRADAIDCSKALRGSGGCTGYARSATDDEPVERCVNCKEFTGYGVV